MPKRKFDDGAITNGSAEAAALSSATAPATTSSTCSASSSCGGGQSRLKAARLDVPPATSNDGSSSSASAGSNKRRVRFDGVTVFYFERSQGFSCVPSFGGTTLGMTQRHHATRKFSLAEHEQALRDQQSQTQQKLAKATNLTTTTTDAAASAATNSVTTITAEESEDEEDEDVEDGEEDAGLAGADGEETEEYFLQPLGGRDRRLLLKSAGVTVDKDERVDCQAIRISRQTCGCSCQGNCLPESCECARDNVKCQVDRPSFPCGCSTNGCGNPEGRVEFNALRVRTHYVQTMMRLRLEQQARFRGTAVPSPTHFRFEDDGSTYCSPPPPPIYDQPTTQRSLCNGFVNGHLNDGTNGAIVNGSVAVGNNGCVDFSANNGHITPTFPALHTFFYPTQHVQYTSSGAAMLTDGFNGFAHRSINHNQPTGMRQLSTQFSLNSSLSTDSGFDESSSNSSPTTPLPLSALYAHQRQRADGGTICCAPETTAMEAPTTTTQTLEETTAAS